MTEAALRLTEFEIGPPAHTSVMSREVVAALQPRRGDVFLDATAGAGGHTEALLEAANEVKVIAFDRDPLAVARTRERLARFGARAEVVHLEVARIEEWMRERSLPAVNGLVADLGLSSPQLSEAKRGMSFRLEGPIDMRMDPTRGETARELIERLDDDDLAELIFKLGEERRARRVARCIKQEEAAGRLETTFDLRRAVVRAVGPARIGGVDPATRTFQALRIAVNDEFSALDALLRSLPQCLAPGGRVVMLTFHSGEDRRVKKAFQAGYRGAVYSDVADKVIRSTKEETFANRRAAAAKLRWAVRAANHGTPDNRSV